MVPPWPNYADSLAWKFTNDGDFTVSSAYKMLANSHHQTHVDPFPKIWEWHGSHQVRTFLWRVAHEALLTNKLRAWPIGKGLTLTVEVTTLDISLFVGFLLRKTRPSLVSS
ncbi:unnamed protein product [Lupinus luteus]|uniref:Reverse transcriptase zinc-binding domain-containing protein n=1 Tax=Lupinus luteus TaxID=3873 RepID=A0AAV1XWJ7_LUPLU